jgi:TetR/AcrR family transcriptional regulator, repressor of fatR-cypB operon
VLSQPASAGHGTSPEQAGNGLHAAAPAHPGPGAHIATAATAATAADIAPRPRRPRHTEPPPPPARPTGLTPRPNGMNIHSVTSRKPDLGRSLIDAAIGLFAERTYEGTQMPAVAQRAGVGVGSIYRYFPSKEALGNAAFQHAKRDLLERLTGAAAGGGEPVSVRVEFGRFWRCFVAYATERPDAFVFLEHQQHDTYLSSESIALAAEIDRIAADFIARGQRAGEIRDGDAGQLVALALGAFAGLVRFQRPDGLAALDDNTLGRAEAAVWDLLRRKDAS